MAEADDTLPGLEAPKNLGSLTVFLMDVCLNGLPPGVASMDVQIVMRRKQDDGQSAEPTVTSAAQAATHDDRVASAVAEERKRVSSLINAPCNECYAHSDRARRERNEPEARAWSAMARRLEDVAASIVAGKPLNSCVEESTP